MTVQNDPVIELGIKRPVRMKSWTWTRTAFAVRVFADTHVRLIRTDDDDLA